MDKQELPIHSPAERLYVILIRAAESSPNSSVVDVLCTSMELEPNYENFIKGFCELLVLLEKTEEQIQQYCSNRKKLLYSRSIQEIKKSILDIIKIGNNNIVSWGTISYLSDPNWVFLESLSTCIEDFEEREIIFNQDRLIELINDVETWIKEIKESQLDEDVKKFFIHKFMEIKRLLENYYYYDSSGIKKEIYATMVEIGLYQEDLTEDKKEENRSFFKDSFEKLSKWAGIVNAPMNTVVIADKLLPIISQTAELVGNTVKHLLPPGI
jgi:hypothetical protein